MKIINLNLKTFYIFLQMVLLFKRWNLLIFIILNKYPGNTATANSRWWMQKLRTRFYCNIWKNWQRRCDCNWWRIEGEHDAAEIEPKQKRNLRRRRYCNRRIEGQYYVAELEPRSKQNRGGCESYCRRHTC